MPLDGVGLAVADDEEVSVMVDLLRLDGFGLDEFYIYGTRQREHRAEDIRVAVGGVDGDAAEVHCPGRTVDGNGQTYRLLLITR